MSTSCTSATIAAKPNFHGDRKFGNWRKAKTIYKTIAKIKEVLRTCKTKGILMSGSGPTVFGIATSRKEAMALKQEFVNKIGHLYRLQFFITKTF